MAAGSQGYVPFDTAFLPSSVISFPAAAAQILYTRPLNKVSRIFATIFFIAFVISLFFFYFSEHFPSTISIFKKLVNILSLLFQVLIIILY